MQTIRFVRMVTRHHVKITTTWNARTPRARTRVLTVSRVMHAKGVSELYVVLDTTRMDLQVTYNLIKIISNFPLEWNIDKAITK